jgi:hypothetical protein
MKGAVMLEKFYANQKTQLCLALLFGIAFGFFLQRGGVTRYDVIMGQLLLEDFTVVKVMLSAVVAGMLGIYCMRALGMVSLHTKPGSLGSSIPGGVLFGVGFALLGYCPGTIAGAVGQGSLDALLGGIPGIILGCGIYAYLYPMLKRTVLERGSFGDITLPRIIPLRRWVVVLAAAGIITGFLFVLEISGL